MAIVATIGVYDGVHTAHVEILNELSDMAIRHGVPSVVFTILYPMEYYQGDFKGLLMTPQERMEMLQEMVDEVFFLDLVEISELEPEDFFEELLRFDVVGLVVGDDFKFGKDGKGDVEALKILCEENGVELVVVEEHRTPDGKRISSSLIRELVMKGEIEKARDLLGRNFTISGKVYRDLGLGRKLGFPTANVDRGHEFLVVPKSGVYFSKVYLPGGGVMYGVTNIGVRPTIGGEDVVKYETHILDFDGDLYGKRLVVELISYMREERKFPSLEELKKAIAEDVRRAREMVP